MKKTLITADSTCYIPAELIPEGIPVIQADIKTKSGFFREGYEVISKNILEYSKRERKPPEVIPPSADDYAVFFKEQLKNAPSVCHLCCHAGSKKSYENAKRAAEKLKNVYVADSQQIGGGMLFQIMQAVRLANEGFSPEFIIKSMGELDGHINSTYASKNALWLSRLKLAPEGLIILMEMLGIAPTVTVRSGNIISGAVFKRGHEYFEMYIRKMLKGKKNIDKSVLILSCPNPFEKNMERFRKEVRKYVKFEKIVVTDIPVRFACRLGEESFGLHFLNT